MQIVVQRGINSILYNIIIILKFNKITYYSNFYNFFCCNITFCVSDANYNAKPFCVTAAVTISVLFLNMLANFNKQPLNLILDITIFLFNSKLSDSLSNCVLTLKLFSYNFNINPG